VIVRFVTFEESSTMYVERALRESTRAFTARFPNSVTWLFGISSASSRNRLAGGFHSTDFALSSYATFAPPLFGAPATALSLAPRHASTLACRRYSPAQTPPAFASTGSGECTPAAGRYLSAGHLKTSGVG